MIKHPFTIDDIPFKDKTGYQDWLVDYNRSPIASLFPIIDNRIFHRRSLKDTIKILQDGYIFSKKDYYEKTDGSDDCFAHQNSYICLFDFHQLPFNIFITHEAWHYFLYDKTPVTILMQIDRDEISKKIVSNSVRRSCHENTGQYLPFVEVWYPESLSVEWIEKIFITFRKNGGVGIENITHHSRVKNNDIPHELLVLLRRQDDYIQKFCQRLLQISQIHKLNLEDSLTTILNVL